MVGDRTKRQLAQYQGTVELKNGAVIENALCGIRTGLREDTVTFATTGGIVNITLYDLQGRVVGANNDSPLQGTATLNVRNVPARAQYMSFFSKGNWGYTIDYYEPAC